MIIDPLLLLYVGAGLALSFLSAVAVYLLLARRRAGGVEFFGGSPNLSDVSRSRPDAYAFILDSDAKTAYWVPLRSQGGYYTFRTKSVVGKFIPVERSIYTVGGRPLYVALRVGDVAIEYSPELAALHKASMMKGESFVGLQRTSFLLALQKLYEEASRSLPSEEEGGREDVLIDITPTTLLTSMIEYLANAVASIPPAIRALSETALETGGAIERSRGVPPSEWGKFLIFIAVGVGVIAIIFAITRMLGL